MEIHNRSLIQEKAILVAKQGDPKSPAPGTLLARQRILHIELQKATAQHQRGLSSDHVTVTMPKVQAISSWRHPDQIRRDIRRIERELRSVQFRLREIDQMIQSSIDKRGK